MYYMDLEEQFQNSACLIKTKEPLPSDPDLLILYGLYRQATQGNCTMSQPWTTQVEAWSRWDAWFKNSGMNRQTAMEKYIEKVNELMSK